MTEEIREGIAKIVCEHSENIRREERIPPETLLSQIEVVFNKESTIDKIINYLHSQGVVIKVERELPEYVGCVSVSDKITKAIAQEAQNDMLKAGYVAVEPLIG